MALKKGTRLFLWIVGLSALLIAVASVAVALLLAEDLELPGKKAESRWLALELGGGLPDGPKPDSLLLDPENIPLTLHDYAATIHAAADDDSVDGLLITLDNPSMGLAKAQELRGALQEFRDAGKPCHVWSKTYENATWYLASVCDEVHLHPEGVPMAIGLSVNTTYFAGLFEEIGVQPDFERVGAYKSAIEAYESTGPSEATVEMYDALLDSLYGTFVADIASGRGMTQDQIRDLVDDPPVTAQTAVDRGMIDQLTYADEFEGEIEPEPFGEYAADVRSSWDRKQKVAVVHLQGTIMDGISTSGGFGGDVIGDASVVPMLEDLQEDEDIVAVVLRVDSPGGSALASDVMWRAIRELNEEKPVVASMSSYAASGGYYIAMAADHIVAQPSTLTGSIGVFGGKFAIGGVYEELGITTWSAQRGELAGLYNLERPFNEPERAKIQERMMGFYTGFVGKAADSRGVAYEELDAVAGGRVWTGAQGLEVGLVDELGGIEVAIERALELAEVEDPDAVGRVILPYRKTLFEVIFDSLDEQQATAEDLRLQVLGDLVGPQGAAALGQGMMVQDILEQGDLVAMHPALIEIR